MTDYFNKLKPEDAMSPWEKKYRATEMVQPSIVKKQEPDPRTIDDIVEELDPTPQVVQSINFLHTRRDITLRDRRRKQIFVLFNEKRDLSIVICSEKYVQWNREVEKCFVA